MYRYYPQILGIIDQLHEWNDKLDKWAADHLDGVGIGTILFFALLIFAFFGIGAFNKKNQ